MTYQKVVLAGGNGYLGGVLARYYRDKATAVVILSRRRQPADGNITTVVWDGATTGEWTAALEGADLLVNLCGKNVNCRYTAENRKEILDSRVIPTRLLNAAIAACQRPPRLWINLSSATIYRHAEDRPQDEATGEIGYGFSIDICKAWEQAFFETATPATRKIALRMGIVLGRSDSAFPRLLGLVKYGLGGQQGDGKQYMSWIHEQDAARCTEWLLQHEQLEGAINATAPNAIQNADMMRTIRTAYGMPIGLPAPQWLLEAGAWLIGTETELILKSRWVLPQRLLDSGYTFSFTEAPHAVHDLLSTRV